MNYKKLSPKKIFLDRDGDGVADSVDLQLHLFPSSSHPAVLSAIMDLSACLGFETMGMNLPLVKTGVKRGSSFNHHLYIGLNQELKEIYSEGLDHNYYLGQEDEVSLARTIREFSLSLISRNARFSKEASVKEDGKRRGFDLLNPYSNRGFFCTCSKSMLPLVFPYKILLFGHVDLNTAVEAANFAARLGLESPGLSLPLTFPFGEKPKHQRSFIYIGKREDLEPCGLTRFGDILRYEWDSGIFLVPSQKRIPDVLICGDEKGLEEILHYLSYLPTDSRGVRDRILNGIKIFQDRLGDLISKEPSRGMSPPRKFVRDYTLPDEREEILKLLEKGAKKTRSKPQSIKIEVLMARPEGVRKKFGEVIKRLFERLGLGKSKIHITILNAYKPGLSWMKEVVLKEIAEWEIDKIEIAFREFTAKGLEESIRWLQELHPVDEIFSRALSLPRERIEFKKDSRIKEVYRVRVWRRGKVIYENQFSPKWNAQPYLLPFPRSGKVHPCTGWVRMKMGEEEIVNQRVKTWTERIWEIYQNKILSLIAQESGRILSSKKPFLNESLFEQLRFDIYFDYPMELLGIDEERISPLEAMHEDLHFVTLDLFSQWLKKKGLKHLSPGRVLPVIHPDFRGKNGRMRFTLVHQSPGAVQRSQRDQQVRTTLRGIFFRGLRTGFDLSLEGEKEGESDRVRKRIRSLKDRDFRIKEILEEDRNGIRLIGVGPDSSKEPKPFQEKIRSAPIDIPMERPIGYGEGIKIIHSLKNLKGVHVVEEGRSFGGLPILSVENTYPCPSAFMSHAKQILMRPTFFINCRHHANEVSSTNAGLKLSYLLATQPQLREFLKKANVVINPMENVDGMVILEEMLKLTPTDKLHGGRYNSAGREYYEEYFNPETPFGEAKVKPAIWERWLPDICVDDHGFPSHEWEQPFSGYAPFRFREWWIPRAFFYFYLPHLEERGGSSRKGNSEVLKNWMIRAVSKDKEILRWNQTFSERYLKYRQRWTRRDRHSKELIPCFPLQRRFRKTNYSYRYPYLTTVDFITEVADETAQGKFLRTCVNAHLQTNLSVLKLLSSFDISVKKLYRYENRQANFMWYRRRPLKFKLLRKEG
jgi:hypothetical protein